MSEYADNSDIMLYIYNNGASMDRQFDVIELSF